MGKLPKMLYGDGLGKIQQVSFGGLRHSVNCTDGEIYDMDNVSVKEFPIMSVRKPRGQADGVDHDVKSIYADNGVLLSVTENGLLYGEMRMIGELKDRESTYFVRFGNRVLMMPDKKLLNLSYRILGEVQPEPDRPDEEWLPQDPAYMDCYAVYDNDNGHKLKVWDGTMWKDAGYFAEPVEVSKTVGAVVIGDGTLYGKPAKANSITIPELTVGNVTNVLRIREGDGIQLGGLGVASNNKTAILREIGSTKEGYVVLRFSDYCFSIPATGEGEQISYEEDELTISRTMPDMDFVFEHGNRLWGAKGKEIFASKLGDPMNWNCFEGLGDSSWYLATQNKGEFTGGISYRYPVFFKEDSMLTVYGTIPSAFQTSESDVAGVRKGCHRSLARCNGYLVWLARGNVMVYDGNSAYPQTEVFGDWKIHDMLSMGDGEDLFCVADLGDHPEAFGERLYCIFRFDTRKGLWTKEHFGKTLCLTESGGKLYALCDTARKSIQVINGGGDGEEEEYSVDSFVEFGDMTVGTMDSKHLSQIRLRVEIGEGTELSLWIQYDSTGEWCKVRQIPTGKKRSVILPVIPRRCDHFRLRLEGHGQWRLFALEKILCQGGTEI